MVGFLLTDSSLLICLTFCHGHTVGFVFLYCICVPCAVKMRYTMMTPLFPGADAVVRIWLNEITSHQKKRPWIVYTWIPLSST